MRKYLVNTEDVTKVPAGSTATSEYDPEGTFSANGTAITEALKTIPNQIQSDWNQTNDSSADYIKNKPTLGNAASKNSTSEIAIDTLNDLPTADAVKNFIEGKGYKTTDNNTTYTLSQDQIDGHKLTFSSSAGDNIVFTIPDNDTWRNIQNNLTSESTEDSLSAAQGKILKDLIDNLPNPMTFKGSLGIDGTISVLPAASVSNTGDTYKIITAGTYEGIEANVGDIIISNGTEWILFPLGIEAGGTVTNIKMTTPTGLKVTGSPITTAGTLALSYDTGYSIPLDSKQQNWDDAYTHSISDHAPVNAQKNVQSDWNQTDENEDDYIKNKPTIIDTKNTAGSTNTTDKIFVVGATSQASNSQTYSNNNVYIENNKLYTNILEANTNIAIGDKTLNNAQLAKILEFIDLITIK